MDTKETEKQIAANFVELARKQWEKNSNPLHVWRAYSECRSAGVVIPEWIYEYFDRVGASTG